LYNRKKINYAIDLSVGGIGFKSRPLLFIFFFLFLFLLLLIRLYYFTRNANRAVASVCQHQLSFLSYTCRIAAKRY